MKNVVAILLILAALGSHAQDSSTSVHKVDIDSLGYKCNPVIVTTTIPEQKPATLPPLYLIPTYQIPKGSVFCRMEDKLNRATKVWIKVGTNNNR